MKFVRSIENFFEKYIEGFFNKQFTSRLQPVEIARQLARLMEDERTVGVSHIYVPNLYFVYISHQEYEQLKLYETAVCGELSAYLTEESRRKGYSMAGRLQIELFADEQLVKQNVRVTATFTDEPCEQNESEACPSSDTRVFDRLNPALLECALIQSLRGIVTVIEGIDAGLKADCSTSRVNIGRRNTNELPLTDLNTSRLHAYIVYEDGCHVLHDAKSLNGTYVDNHRITHKRLKSGDRIKVGNTVILYEVK